VTTTGGAPLAARELPALFRRVHDALAERRDAIDDLNVFPVPDGDTGTNMTLTVRSGLEALHEARPAPPDALATAVIRGAVRGARGNSGVIISQVVRAVVEVVTGHPSVDAKLYASALDHARQLAYEAVAEPVEGTILTVLAAAADAATGAATGGEDLVHTSAAACAATAAAVEATTQQLAVLQAAGVVDAGARGFEILLAAVHGHLTGQMPPVAVDAPRNRTMIVEEGCHAITSQPFEVQYLLDADDDVAPPLRRELELLGDSVVVVAAGGLLNVHVHTAHVGPAIEVGLAHGRPSAIEVTHFGDQLAADSAARPRPALGVVAVLEGAGLTQLAREAGAVVVAGTAGALPSVADLLTAFGRITAERVVVLPGHRNAVATAVKAAEIEHLERGRLVDVVADATSPPAVLASLAVFAPEGDAEEVVAELRAVASEVHAGEVVTAIRDADTAIGAVRAGQSLAVAGGVVVSACDAPLDALTVLCDALRVPEAELVTLLLGADVDAELGEAAAAAVGVRTEAEMEVIDAGCRPSLFWLSAE
jgi:uncharacterized protein